MPDHVITADLLLNVQGQKLAKEIEDSIGSGIKSASDDVKRNLSRAYRDAVVSGITSGQAGDAWKNLLKSGVVEAQQQFEKVAQKLMAAEKRLSETKDKNLQKRLKEEVKLLSRQANAAEKIYRDKDRAIKREQALLRDAAKEARQGSSVGDMMQQRAEGLRGLLSGGPLSGNLTRGLQGLGQRAHTAGEARVQQAQMAGMNGAPNQQVATMAKVGRSLAKIGAGLATVAAAVGAIVVLVKLFADLEAKIKDMNKVLVESAGSADFGFSAAEIRAGKLREALEEIRDETTGVNENFRKFRATAKEQQQLLSTMNQAGFTYAKMNKEIERSTELVKSYSDITAIAITYGRNLGVDANQVAQTMGDLSVETGQSLDQIAEGFTIVTREALNAGFSTKRFFSTVVEASSGLAFYGVRLEESAKLLSNLGTVMGEVAGAGMFKDFARRGAKSYQDSLKEFLVKDPEFFKAAYETTYRQRLAQYEREYADRLGGVSVEQLLEETGGGANLAERLAGMGISGQGATDLLQLSDLRRASGGDLGSMALARKGAGPAFEAVAALRTMQGLGGGSVSEVVDRARAEGDGGVARLIALANVNGEDQLNELVKLDERFRGQYQLLQKIAMGDAEMTDELKSLGYFIERQPDGTAKIMKGIMDDSGAIDKQNAEEITDHLQMLLVEPSEDSKLLKRQLTEDQQVAMEMSRQVTGLNEIMEQTITAILNDIYDVLVSIADYMFKDDPERQAELHFQERMADESKAATENLQKLTDEQDDLNRKMEKGQDLTKAEEARMAALPSEIARAMDEAEIARDAALFAENFTGAEIGTNMSEARRMARERAGDVEAASEAAKQRAQSADARAKGMSPSMYGADNAWLRWGGDMSQMGFGGGMKALADRAMVGMGGAGYQAEMQARIGKRLGMTGYADLSEEQIEQIGKAAQEGAEGVYKNRGIGRDILGLGTTSNQISVQQQSAREISTTLENIEKATEESARVAKDNSLFNRATAALSGIFSGGATKANDLIIPAGGGKPVITDERDTLMAFKPGGPISQGMGGSGGKGGVNIQIYGGDQKKVYDTVMRVLKATGNA